ncbi:beach-domain-containing protein [Viridothelium virens]|uniref:Beach-domain-containing protein n=1 Tax=Viridothelium virens TaxID=1048519 RepID=A0A6A6HDC7_VIRVR|nr:beach-domain-containing protein [Viridothelium virens]
MDGRARQHRSSSAASSAFPSSPEVSKLQELLKTLTECAKKDHETLELGDYSSISDKLREVRPLLINSSHSLRLKDAFRHAHGFEILLDVLEYIQAGSNATSLSLENTTQTLELLKAVLNVLSESLYEHRGNRRYFETRVRSNGWQALEKIIRAAGLERCWHSEELQESHVYSHLFGCLFSFMLRDEEAVSAFKGLKSLISSSDESQSQIVLQDTTNTAKGVKSQGKSQETTHSVSHLPIRAVHLRVENVFKDSDLIQNPEILPFIFDMWLRLPRVEFPDSTELRLLSLFVISTYVRLAKNSAFNLIAMHSSGVFSQMLPLLVSAELPSEEQVQLLSVCEELACLGVNTLEDAHNLYDLACRSDSASGFLHKALEASAGPPYIQFDLSLHGFASAELPTLGQPFPPLSSSAGYTFTAWIRIDKFDKSCHTTIFGAFDASQTCFVLGYLEKDTHQFILQTSITSSRPSVRFKNALFEQGRWYHIALIHRRPKPTASSRATLLIDGEFVEQAKVQYPQSPPQTNVATGGSSTGHTETLRKALRVQAFLGTPQDLAARLGRNVVSTRWSLASAHLFSEVLSEELIVAYHKVGPRYNGNFQDCLGSFQTYRASAEVNLYNETLHPGKEEKSDILTAMRLKASDLLDESRIMLSISPTNVLDDDDHNNVDESQLIKSLSRPAAKSLQHYTRSGSNAVVINAAVPAINDALTQLHGVAILTGEPVVLVPQPLDEASWRLAGCVAVGLRLLQAAQTSEAVIRAVKIIFATVDHDWRNSEAMEKEHGFGILACLLRDKMGLFSTNVSSFGKAEPIHIQGGEWDAFTQELLQIILKFVGFNEQRPEESMLVNALAFRVLLVDFDTWRRTGIETQKLYYSVFGILVDGSKYHNFNARRLARMRIIKRFLDALKGERFNADVLPHFMGAFKSLMKCSHSPDTWRSLALFVTFALQDDRAFRTTSLHRSKSAALRVRARSAQYLSSPNGRSSPSNASDRDPSPKPGLSRSDLALSILEVIADLVCDKTSTSTASRFARTVTVRWTLHLLAEMNPRVIVLVVKIIARLLVVNGSTYVRKFGDRSGGFIVLKNRLRAWWNVPTLWTICFAILFGFDVAKINFERDFDLYSLMETFLASGTVAVKYPEILPVLTSMLEQGLRTVVKQESEAATPSEAKESAPALPSEPATPIQRKRRSMSLQNDITNGIGKQNSQERVSSYGEVLNTVIRFLADIQTQSQPFSDFTMTSTYVQDLLFVLYPVVVGSDNVSANEELHSKHSVLNFQGQDVPIRPHSRSTLQSSPIVRTSVVDPPSDSTHPRADPLRRGSSFILVTSESGKYSPSSARLNPVMSPDKDKPVSLNIGNSIVEGLLEVVVAVFKEQIFERKEFTGFGLFLKSPPGFQEHQAYFESYVLLHTMRDLSNAVQLEQKQLLEPRVINNLARYCHHMGEAVYEGWFMNGAEPLLDFTGHLIDYLQRPDIAQVKNVRLCSQAISMIRTTFLRVVLLRLSELQESESDDGTVSFLNKMIYWQTILLGPENVETYFLRLICYLLYTKLVSIHQRVRLAAADLWRMLLVQKPSETSYILSHAFTTEQTPLTSGFLKLMEVDNETFLFWIDDHREELDALFFGAMSKIWEQFVAEENRKTEETARNRLNKRREKLKQWAAEESAADNISHRHESATSHWRVNIHSAERMKHQRALQDEQDNVIYLGSCYDKLEKLLRKPCGLLKDERPPKWQLDESEGRNRMRMRVIPAKGIQQDDYQPKRKVSEKSKVNKLKLDTTVGKASFEAINATPALVRAASEGRPSANRLRSDSSVSKDADIQEDDFEIVDEPTEDADNFEDKNRKVLRSLQRGDEVQHLSNVARIVGLEPVEGLLIVGKDSLYLMDDFFQRADGEVISVAQASAEERDPYLQMIAGRETKTRKPQSATGELMIRHWRWGEAISISKRRFLFRDVGIEIFFADGRSYLLIAPSPAVRNDLHSKLLARAPHVSSSAPSPYGEDTWRLESLRNPDDTPQSFGSRFANVFNSAAAHPATRRWVRGEISNFHYLMLVNTMAGRTFNDLTQYPVFPWVLSDYTCEELDLSDPRTFRDLSKPMGCQNPAREADFRERYKSFAEMGGDDAPPFHYGTHYSSAMIVTSYLIRLQPFVQSYLLLQGGNFDHADRLFYSIEKAWTSASRDNMSDVRELTPEFFYLPEFLTNINEFNFGTKQGNNEQIDNVNLPPWAKGDPQIFIAKHREALESPYVSQHLHQWIDLVFGYKQRGEAALEATNVFHHLSYQGAKDLDSIEDPLERRSTIGIIHNFGQTPHQVFQRQHPPREEAQLSARRLDNAAESLTKLPFTLLESQERVTSLIYSQKQDRLLCSGAFRLNIPPTHERYMEWGFADGSVRFYDAGNRKLVGLFEHLHTTQLSHALFADASTLVTAGNDSVVSIWTVASASKHVDLQPKTSLFGHKNPVTILCASRSTSTLLTADTGGAVYLWDLNREEFIRTLRDGTPDGGSGRLECAKINNVTGTIVLCIGRGILLYTLNGTLLLEQVAGEAEDDHIASCAWYEGVGNEWLERELLFTGHKWGIVNIWNKVVGRDGKWHLRLVKRLDQNDPPRDGVAKSAAAISCLLPMAQAVYTGDEDGMVYEWDCVQRQ